MNAQAPVNLQGNHACALGAIAAGCAFYAGYPITPSSEIAERMARELPKAGGVFIQMEDEIASMAAVVGASMGGARAMTATSGPGFSLKQENIGLAAMMEAPCVIVNVMRGGPSTGMPTRPAQADIMQARWGSHGDRPVIALCPASVQEAYAETIRAFALAERLRTPVVLLMDEVIGHMVETVTLTPPTEEEKGARKWADEPKEGFLPYRITEDGVPPFPRPGDGYRAHATGLTHDESGFPTQDPARVAVVMRRLLGKIDKHRDIIDKWECVDCEDAEVVVTAVGIAARAARAAVRAAREKGVKAGLFRPVTLWPFPEEAFRAATAQARAIIVPEMNAGQMVLEVQRLARDEQAVVPVNRFDGEPIAPREILASIEEALT